MNILVRNMSRTVTEKVLEDNFKPFGAIQSILIVKDLTSGRSKGFGFVEMPDKKETAAAIKGLNGKVVHGEKIRVKLSRTRPKRK